MILPSEVLKALLDGGGMAAAISLAIFFVMSGVVMALWFSLRGSTKDYEKFRETCDEKITGIYERQILLMRETLETVNRIVDKNTLELAQNTRVVESRADAIRAMTDMLVKLTALSESYTSNMRVQANRIENNQMIMIEMLRSGHYVGPRPPIIDSTLVGENKGE